MSRIIIKNIPKNFSEKEIKDHFLSEEVTDCKVVRDEHGKSRKFAFVGFKQSSKAKQVKQKYSNTYLGASRIHIDVARALPTDGRDGMSKQDVQNGQKTNTGVSKQLVNRKYDEYKKIVEEGYKKSWDDVLTPKVNQGQGDNPESDYDYQAQKKSKKETLKDKKTRKEEQIRSDKAGGEENGHYSGIKPMKPLKLTEKNKKYLNRPLELDQTRLYITNLPYVLEEQELRKAFQKYGNITKVKLPKEYDGKTKGFGFVSFQKSEEAMRAFSQTDNKNLFGRIVHVKPAMEDVGSIIKNAKEAEFEQKVKQKYGDSIDEKTSYKKQKKREMRQKLSDQTNWNTLFLNPNTILERMSRKLKITKSEILLSDNLAAKMALAETEVIQETKQWMKSQGLNLDFVHNDKSLCERSTRTILVKNLNHRIQEVQLRELFEFYGIVVKILLAPNRAIGIVEFENSDFAANAFEKLQNHKFKNNFLYLEYAPIGMLSEKDVEMKKEQAEQEALDQDEISKVVYVKNLNFETEEGSLWQLFETIGPLKYAKIIKSKEGKSMGYGFVEFQKTENAVSCLKKLQNKILDGHKLSVSMSRKKAESIQKVNKMKAKIISKSAEEKNTKLSVKNLAFQASKKDIEELFKQFGSVKTIRLPKKMDGSHRGFAFVEYNSTQDAALAKEALGKTHLYGRKLVIEYETGRSTKSKQ